MRGLIIPARLFTSWGFNTFAIFFWILPKNYTLWLISFAAEDPEQRRPSSFQLGIFDNSHCFCIFLTLWYFCHMQRRLSRPLVVLGSDCTVQAAVPRLEAWQWKSCQSQRRNCNSYSGREFSSALPIQDITSCPWEWGIFIGSHRLA